MAFPKSLFLFLALFIAATVLLCSAHAYTLEVGGSKGWSLHPPESYNVWAERMRFSINDTLHFRYNNATDSVLVVSKDDYDKCNSNNPITKLDGGDSSFTFDRSGPFFFITGNKSNCDQGQKIHIIVLAVRNNQPPSASPLSPTPSASAPTTGSPAPGAGISPASAPGTSTTTPADVSAPPPARSSARPAFNAASTVSIFVMISFALLGFVN